MILTHHGAEFFKVSFGDVTVAFNPISKESSLKQSRFGADIALVSLEHPDMNGVEQLSLGSKEPFTARGPGAYEVRDVLIKGYPSVSQYGGVERINTIYLLTLEKMNLLFLGALSEPNLPSELKEVLDDIDILFVPIGGEGVLSPSQAHELSVSIEPRLVVPMHYCGIGAKNALETYLKEAGAVGDTAPKPTDKLTLKIKDLEGKENDIVVFGC